MAIYNFIRVRGSGTSELILDLFLAIPLLCHLLVELLRPLDELVGLRDLRVGREGTREVHPHVEDDIGPVVDPIVNKTCWLV